MSDSSSHRESPNNGIFLKAIELATLEQREAYLDQACGKDNTRRRELVELVANYCVQDEFLQGAAAANPAGLNPKEHSGILGSVIGPYKLLEQIGEGGFGTVFVAEQEEPIRRKVALKIIKAGLDTQQVIARFEAERQALALMECRS